MYDEAKDVFSIPFYLTDQVGSYTPWGHSLRHDHRHVHTYRMTYANVLGSCVIYLAQRSLWWRMCIVLIRSDAGESLAMSANVRGAKAKNDERRRSFCSSLVLLPAFLPSFFPSLSLLPRYPTQPGLAHRQGRHRDTHRAKIDLIGPLFFLKRASLSSPTPWLAFLKSIHNSVFTRFDMTWTYNSLFIVKRERPTSRWLFLFSY